MSGDSLRAMMVFGLLLVDLGPEGRQLFEAVPAVIIEGAGQAFEAAAHVDGGAPATGLSRERGQAARPQHGGVEAGDWRLSISVDMRKT